MARRASTAALRRGGVGREAFRVLASNLTILLADLERPTVIITSATEGEGKTTTCAGLARAFAASGRRVVVLDLDLRHANLHGRLGGHNEFGVSDVLLEQRRLDDCLQRVSADPTGRGRWSLYLLAAGKPVANPPELLGSGRALRLLEALSAQADVVLIDSPPVLPVADTLVIGRMAAGALLVVEPRRTPIPTVQRAKDALIRNQTRLLGVVLNKLASRDLEFGYGYRYGDRPLKGTPDEM